MAIIKINGRDHFVQANNVTLTEDKPGHFTLIYDGRVAQIIGGVKSGGGPREWLFKNELFFGDRWIRTHSLVSAVKNAIVY